MARRPVVVALGGNALVRRGEKADAATQRGNVAVAARAIAGLARERDVVVTHGNGPQVGLLALQSDDPLDVLDAESEGMVGYLLEQELENELRGRPVATLLTQVLVDADDPAFGRPTKPIGVGDRRRLVASPEPLGIIELTTIRLLIEAGVLVVCAGGGGIPVVETADGLLHGVEAVVDKDLATALLARELDAEALMILTDVPAVEAGRGTPQARPIDRASVAELRGMDWDSGSMGPKVEAACRFAEATRRPAVIGALADAEAVLRGDRGTRVVP